MSCPRCPANRSSVKGWCGLTAEHRAASRSAICPFSAGNGDRAGRAVSQYQAPHRCFSAYPPASWLRPLGHKGRAVDDLRPETLLALPAALPAQVVVGDTVAVIEEKSPFRFPLLAHSWHGGSFLPFLSGGVIGGVLCIVSVSFLGFFCPVSPLKKVSGIAIGCRAYPRFCMVWVSFRGSVYRSYSCPFLRSGSRRKIWSILPLTVCNCRTRSFFSR